MKIWMLAIVRPKKDGVKPPKHQNSWFSFFILHFSSSYQPLKVRQILVGSKAGHRQTKFWYCIDLIFSIFNYESHLGRIICYCIIFRRIFFILMKIHFLVNLNFYNNFTDRWILDFFYCLVKYCKAFSILI